jgi:nucleotide-binding universal stress UspA family protein
MNRIVVPTDFSDCAMNALKVAAVIARKTNFTITLAHVYEVPVYGLTAGGMQGLSYDGEALSTIKEKIKTELGKIAALDFLKGLTLEKFVLADRSISEILDHPELKNVSIIVMGSHGVSGIKENLVGSNTEKIVRKSKVPVLTVKNDAGTFEVKNIVFASSFYEEVEKAYAKVKPILDHFPATIHLLKVNTANRFERTLKSEELMRNFAKNAGIPSYTMNVFNDDSIEDGVLNFSNAIDADLIVMPTHGRTGIAHLVNGSVTEGLVNHAYRPVLSMRIEEPQLEYGVYFPDK